MKDQIPAEDIAAKLVALAKEIKPSALGTAGFLYSLAGWLYEGGDDLVKHQFKTCINPQDDIDRCRAKKARQIAQKNANALDA